MSVCFFIIIIIVNNLKYILLLKYCNIRYVFFIWCGNKDYYYYYYYYYKSYGAGEGNFRAAGIFFRYQILCMNFFRPKHEYFLGLIGVHEFFFRLIFPCANTFFVLRLPPPTPPNDKFSKSPSLISSCNLILFSGENIACCTWNTFAVLQTSLR